MQLIHQNGERLFVTSRDISNRFGKRHDDVLKAVRALDCSEDFRRRNFAESVYHRPNPSGGKAIAAPMFEITRDGFTFLCMGFTGQQAALWKERYIDAFNMMERALKDASAVSPQQAFAVDIARKLADELGEMRRTIDAQGSVITALYGKVEGAQRAQISALRSLHTLRHRQATREAVETVIRLEAQGVPRAEIAALTGKTLNHVKQIAFQARASGRLPPLEKSRQGELPLETQQ